METGRTNLVGATLREIESAIAAMNEPGYRARQIYAGIYQRRLHSWEEFTDLGKQFRKSLGDRFTMEHPSIRQIFTSQDGARRYLFELGPGERIESVFIPEERRDTFCISTQVGCAVGCLFCVTGRMGLTRNLTAGEIVGQVLSMHNDRGVALKRLNIVIMGMGEPLNNYENVMRAIRLMTDEQGMSVSPRRITLSTSGVVPGIKRLAEEPSTPNLAISLNATTDDVRNRLIPINRKWNIKTLLDACRAFPLAQRKRITFEYVLIGGVNDSPDDARRLVRLLDGLRKKINLIPLNGDPCLSLDPPSVQRVEAFERILVNSRVTVSVRRPRGDDVSAACGMLAGRDHAQG